MALCERYVNTAVRMADFIEVRRLAIDETSRAKGHDHVTLFADAQERKVIYVAEGNEAAMVGAFAANFRAHHGKPTQIEAVSIDMWPAFIRGGTDHLPHAQITFDKFHVIAHASEAIAATRRQEQKLDPDSKGLRWALLKERTARAWHYREQLREILTRKQPNVVRVLLNQWCLNVMRSKKSRP